MEHRSDMVEAEACSCSEKV